MARIIGSRAIYVWRNLLERCVIYSFTRAILKFDLKSCHNTGVYALEIDWRYRSTEFSSRFSTVRVYAFVSFTAVEDSDGGQLQARRAIASISWPRVAARKQNDGGCTCDGEVIGGGSPARDC